ncbi:hypothetical protein WJX74_004016 [Apatococcus lobatus]|uniref:USP domain-containing protein n=1 Tax=Apatococcus lobatus TaxID=904363 RepID=A0AAW1RH68_9CHLO
MAKGKKKQSRKAPAKVKSRVRPGIPLATGAKPTSDPRPASTAPLASAASSSASEAAALRQPGPSATSSAPVPKGPLQVKGLTNLGNTCFFNSALQVLSAAPAMQKHFQPAVIQGSGGVTGALLDVIQGVAAQEGEKGGAFNPKQLLTAICKVAPRFKGRQQQDSHELLVELLDALESEEKAARKRLRTKGDAPATEGFLEKAPQTYVEQTFGGQLASTVTCKGCCHSSRTLESFLDLSLPIPAHPSSSGSAGFHEPPGATRAETRSQAKAERKAEKQAAMAAAEAEEEAAVSKKAGSKRGKAAAKERKAKEDRKKQRQRKVSTEMDADGDMVPSEEQLQATGADHPEEEDADLSAAGPLVSDAEADTSTEATPDASSLDVSGSSTPVEEPEPQRAGSGPGELPAELTEAYDELDGLEAPEGSAQDVSDAESTAEANEAAAQLADFVHGLSDSPAQQGSADTMVAANVALSPAADGSNPAAEGDAMEMGDLGGLFDENGVEAGGALPWTKPEEEQWEADASDFWAPDAPPADVLQEPKPQPATGAQAGPQQADPAAAPEPAKAASAAGDTGRQTITLQSCLAAFFAEETVQWECPEAAKAVAAAAAASPKPAGSALKRSPSAASFTSDMQGAVCRTVGAPGSPNMSICTPPPSAGMRRSVSFSEGGPAVKFIPGSAEQRGTDFKQALRGGAYYCRPVKHEEDSKQAGLLITARMLGLDRNRLQLCLSPHDDEPATLDVLRAPIALASVAVAEVEDSDDEEEQQRVQKQAQSLLDCAADLLRSEGLTGTRAMLSGVHFQPQDSSLHRAGSGSTWPLAGHMPASAGQDQQEWSYPVATPHGSQTSQQDRSFAVGSLSPVLSASSLQSSSGFSPTVSPSASCGTLSINGMPVEPSTPPPTGSLSVNGMPLEPCTPPAADTHSSSSSTPPPGSFKTPAAHFAEPMELAAQIPPAGVREPQGPAASQAGAGSAATSNQEAETHHANVNGISNASVSQADAQVVSTDRGSAAVPSPDSVHRRGKQQESSKQYRIHRTPPLLSVHLKRFQQDLRGRLRKISGHIPFGFDLNLRPFLEPSSATGSEEPEDASMSYNLVGVVEHQGSSIQSGHYVAYVQRGIPTPRNPCPEDQGPSARVSPDSNAASCSDSGPIFHRAEPQGQQQSGTEPDADHAASQPDTEQAPNDNCSGQEQTSAVEQAIVAGQAPSPAAPDRLDKPQEAVQNGSGADRPQASPSAASHDAPAVQAASCSHDSQIAASGNNITGLPKEAASDGSKWSTELDWYCISDTHVKRVSQEAVAACEAYILLYTRA